MRGITETIRGSAVRVDDGRGSYTLKRNATEADLLQARQRIGSVSSLPWKPTERYQVVDVRLDSLKRLLVDVVRIGFEPEKYREEKSFEH